MRLLINKLTFPSHFGPILVPALALYLSLLTSTIAQASVLKVMIDPGHGGVDSGATHGNARESEIALKVSLLLKEKLSHNSDFLADMTRSTNHNVTLQERVKMAQRAHSDLFLSIHLNANPDPRAKGVELYFQNHLPPDEDTFFLANTENRADLADTNGAGENTADFSSEPTKKNDIASIVEDLERNHRMLSSHRLSLQLLKAWSPTQHQSVNIRQAPFYVVSKATIPSVLVELGFISNPKEAERLSNEAYQGEIADKIYRGLVLYKESLALSNPPVGEKN